MKKSTWTTLLAGALPAATFAGLKAYANLKEGRSLSSFEIEQLFRLLKVKEKFKNDDPEKFQVYIKQAEEKNTVPFESPEKWLHTHVNEVEFEGMQTFIWNDKYDPKQKIIYYLHGGAYLNQPISYHFKAINNIAKKLDAKVVFPIYPKLPRYTYKDTLPKVYDLYCSLLKQTPAKNITLMGDSAGGGLALGLASY